MQHTKVMQKCSDRHGSARLGCLLLGAEGVMQVVLLSSCLCFKRNNSRVQVISERSNKLDKHHESLTVLKDNFFSPHILNQLVMKIS